MNNEMKSKDNFNPLAKNRYRCWGWRRLMLMLVICPYPSAMWPCYDVTARVSLPLSLPVSLSRLPLKIMATALLVQPVPPTRLQLQLQLRLRRFWFDANVSLARRLSLWFCTRQTTTKHFRLSAKHTHTHTPSRTHLCTRNAQLLIISNCGAVQG